MNDNKVAIQSIFVILTVIVLLLPIGLAMYVEDKSTANIIAVQGLYDGDTVGLYSGSKNTTELFEGHTSWGWDNPIGWDSNSDTAFLGYKSGGIPSGQDSVYYGNYNTYVGSGEHTMSIDWNDIPEGTYNSIRYLFIPLNITCSELADYDFARASTDMIKTNGSEVVLYFELNPTNILSIPVQTIDSETDIFIMTQTYKNLLNLNPNGSVWLSFRGLAGEFDESQTSFSWMIENINLEPKDYVFGSEFSMTAVWFIMMMFLCSIYTVAAIFINPWFDTKLDMKKGK